MDPSEMNREHVLNMLSMDHKRIKDYFAQVAQAKEPQQKLSFAQTALNELAIHSALEEEIFYPWVKVKKPLIESLLDRCAEQHKLMSKLASELGDGTDKNYQHRFAELTQIVTDHIAFEEKEIFVQLGDLDLGSLAPILDMRRNQLMKQSARDNEKLLIPEQTPISVEDESSREQRGR